MVIKNVLENLVGFSMMLFIYSVNAKSMKVEVMKFMDWMKRGKKYVESGA
ncbi:MAG: hypothetical protein J5857_10220 [Treponema sp.]|nr:hypothetical protein [Treponema sp.]